MDKNGSVLSLQMISNIEGKLQAYRDVLEMLNDRPVYMSIEAGK